jgi:hypothetical protein
MQKLMALPRLTGTERGEALASSDKTGGNYPRVTVRLTGDLGSAIDDLQSVTAASSPSEVVRRAIVIYHTLVSQKIKGNEPYIEVKEGDSIRKVPIFL